MADDGILEEARIVTFASGGEKWGRVFVVWRSALPLCETGRSRARDSFSDDVDEPVFLDPSEPRFCWPLATTPGPVERFKPIPEVVPLAYRLDVGTGKNVGVVGREDGVGIVLMVAVVLWLSPERRDCGLRLVIMLWGRGLGL